MNIQTPTVDALLPESAPLAQAWSLKHCTADPQSGESCAWYHGVWQYFRLLGVVASPLAQETMFCKALQPLAISGECRRVLISGTSDYSMLAVVLNAFAAVGVTPEISVVDRCRTPLLLNDWYAQRRSLQITTVACDMVDYTCEKPFDLICTHSFLGNFAPHQRPGLFANWNRLLRPGGRLIAVNRIRPGKTQPQVFSASQAQALQQRVMQQTQSMRGDFDVSQQQLLEWCRRYTSLYRSYPLTSKEDLLTLLNSNGFSLQDFQIEATAGGRKESGPATAGAAGRAFFVAIKA